MKNFFKKIMFAFLTKKIYIKKEQREKKYIA